MKLDAYWFKSINGKIMDIDVQDGEHAFMVADKPESFGISKERFEEIKQEGTKILGNRKLKRGWQSAARELLILEALKNGWFRVRRYTRPDYWSINVSDINKQKEQILDLLLHLEKKGSIKDNSDVVLDDGKGKNIKSSYAKLYNKLYESTKIKRLILEFAGLFRKD